MKEKNMLNSTAFHYSAAFYSAAFYSAAFYSAAFRSAVLYSTLFAVFIIVLSGGCSSARRSEPIKGPMKLASAELTEGEKLFDRHCSSCHPGGEAGLGPALNNKSIVPSFMVKFQVRNGLGKMPAFSREQIPPDELDKIVKYVKALQSHD